MMTAKSSDLVAPVESSNVARRSPSELGRPQHTTGTRWISVARELAIVAAFVGISVMLRGGLLSHVTWINPDEAELIAQARAAMRSPVPFTTWTTTTTGPLWVLSLALLGAIGFPMTIAFAHLLAAVLTGLIGYLGFTLARRWMHPAMGAIITGFWWLPIVLTLTGPIVDFAPLSTELLPCALILAAALVRTDYLVRGRLPYLASGLLCGLAIGSKYQAAPLALALLVVQLILAGNYRWRTLLRGAVLWGVGVLLPFVILGLIMVASSDVSTTAIRQNINFLGAYGSALTLADRLARWSTLVTPMHVVILVLVMCWLGSRSTGRVQICRLILVVGGLTAVFAGGMGFPHYLFFVYTAIALAIGLPLKPDAQLVPYVRNRLVAASTVGVILALAWFVTFGPSKGTANLTGRHDLSIALSTNSVVQGASLVQACPVGSHVLVWGWAGEMYINYGWTNAIPFMNIQQLTSTSKNSTSGYELVLRAVEDPATDCVIDAVGAPFWGVTGALSLATVYPQIRSLLDQEYRKAAGAVQCEVCTVYVRR